MAPIGLLLSWGTFTPLGHLFAQIPFYNKVRLDSRSLGIVDLALAIGFGFWLELFLAGEWRERLAGPGRWWREVVAPMVFPVAGFLVAAVMFAIPTTVLVALGAVPIDAPGRRVWMAAQAAVALGAIAVIWAWRHWSPERARRLLVVVVAADLGLFALTCSTGMFAGGQPEPTRAEAAPIVGNVGRFAIVDRAEHRADIGDLGARHQRVDRARQRAGLRLHRERRVRPGDRRPLHCLDGPVRAGPRRLRAAAAPDACS